MTITQDEILAKIPQHLQQFVAHQDYSQYTAQDHAVWRYIMKQNLRHLSTHAHPVYLDGLKKTGISLDHIPSIDEMNFCLEKIGWMAVVVDGFIPPSAFMEFQALKILTIAVDMRTIEHVLYTPAPDIVHESAGHAPFIVDPEYADYLQKFGEIGSKAMYTKADFEIYEAIRELSIIKENPHSSPLDIELAENDLKAKMASNLVASEAALLSRLHWWTVEYGLVGDINNFKLFGAGLLSSVGESKHCLSAEVKKIPLSLSAVQIPYDITRMQPQLFVTNGCQEMISLLESFADSLCYRKGGISSIKTAIESEIISTVLLSSGLQISGKWSEIIVKGNRVDFIKALGPCQLAYENIEIDGHGIDYHSSAYSSPIGFLKDGITGLENLSDEELKSRQIEINRFVQLEFESGIRLSGILKNVLKRANKIILMTFENCTIIDNNSKILYDPSWGVFDLAVGTEIVSVFAGSADKDKFNTYKGKSSKVSFKKSESERDNQLFCLYQDIRNMRESKILQHDRILSIHETLSLNYPHEWLLRLEMLELILDAPIYASLKHNLISQLMDLRLVSEDYNILISNGLEILNIQMAS